MIWPWILGFLLVMALLFGGCVTLGVLRVRAPVDATNTFVAALDEGRLDEAYDSLCASTRAAVTREQFKADHPLATQITGYTFTSLFTASGQLTQVSGTISVDGTPRPMTYSLDDVDGGWRVCGYEPLT